MHARCSSHPIASSRHRSPKKSQRGCRPTARLAFRSKRHGGVIVTRSQAEAIALANAAAPEHMVVDDEATAAQIRCVGSLFVGSWTAQVAGDYAIGSNHVLPTAGAARVRGGLSAADFVRQITVQRVTRAGLSRIGRQRDRSGAGGRAPRARGVDRRSTRRLGGS